MTSYDCAPNIVKPNFKPAWIRHASKMQNNTRSEMWAIAAEISEYLTMVTDDTDLAQELLSTLDLDTACDALKRVASKWHIDVDCEDE